MKTHREMVQAETIKTGVKEYILSNFLPGEKDDSLRDDDLLFEGGIIDSAGALTLVSFLEERYGIEVLEEELFPENFASIENIVSFVSKKLKNRKLFRK
jgi:acyl carrier protein